MSSILTIEVKGVSRPEIIKNFQILDSFMNSQQTVFKLVSDINFNPRIYYSKETLITKIIHDIINILKTDKNINKTIREISYSGHLNKI